jgi:hypothetical protein
VEGIILLLSIESATRARHRGANWPTNRFRDITAVYRICYEGLYPIQKDAGQSGCFLFHFLHVSTYQRQAWQEEQQAWQEEQLAWQEEQLAWQEEQLAWQGRWHQQAWQDQ